MNLRIAGITLVTTLIALSGCMTVPMTADEFREQARHSSFLLQTKHYDISRPYESVVKSLAWGAHECLDATVETRSQSSGKLLRSEIWTPKIIAGKNRTELHVFSKSEGQGTFFSPAGPEDGYYMFVVDVIRDGKATQVDLYAPDKGRDHVVAAIEGWVQKGSDFCPDLTDTDW